MAFLILNPYTPGPAATAERYEPWLRSEDNPTFNAEPAMGEYSNWKVIASPKAGWTHFDFFAVADEAAVERVWFSPELGRFRSRWVSLWGFGAVPGSGHATLFEAGGEPFRTRNRFIELAFDAPGAQWEATSTLRKHWALGPAPAGEPWRRPIAEFNPLGISSLALTFHAERPASSNHLIAECIAAPGEFS